MSAPSADELDKLDMERLARGGDAALNELMERHGLRLFHYLLRLLRDEFDTADIAQETFAKVYLNRTRFRADSKFSTWLFAIATNLVRDHFRRRKRRPEVSLEANEEEHGSLGERLADHSNPPDKSLLAQEQSETVARAVQALPEDLRTPLILAEYEDKSQAEIAGILDCSVKAVEMRIYRARQSLRKSLAGFMEASAAASRFERDIGRTEGY